MSRILYVAENLWPPPIEMAGMSAIYNNIKQVAKRDHDVHVLTSIRHWTGKGWKGWFEKESKKQGIEFSWINIEPINEIPLLGIAISKLLLFLKILKLHEEYKFDIIHEYSSSPLLLYPSLLYKKLLKTKVVHTICAYQDSISGSVLSKKPPKLDKIICTTKYMAKKLKSPQTEVLLLGIDTKKFKRKYAKSISRKKLKLPVGDKIVLYLGPLEERKGAFTLTKAMPMVIKKNPKALFVFGTYGRGGVDRQHKKNKENLIKKAGDRFKILEGLLDVPTLMSAADVLVVPQTTPHGTIMPPLTLLEGIASEIRIVGSDTPGIKEILYKYKAGFIFRNKDEIDLAEKINKALSSKKTDKQDWRKELDIENTSQKMLRIYENL